MTRCTPFSQHHQVVSSLLYHTVLPIVHTLMHYHVSVLCFHLCTYTVCVFSSTILSYPLVVSRRNYPSCRAVACRCELPVSVPCVCGIPCGTQYLTAVLQPLYPLLHSLLILGVSYHLVLYWHSTYNTFHSQYVCEHSQCVSLFIW